MSIPVQSQSTRSDVAAIGPILSAPKIITPSNNFQDVFFMAIIASPNSPYIRNRQGMNGNTLALATALVDTSSPSLNSKAPNIAWSEAAWGSELLNGQLWNSYLSDNISNRLVTFRLAGYEMTKSTDRNSSYDEFLKEFKFQAYQDIEGRQPYTDPSNSNNLFLGYQATGDHNAGGSLLVLGSTSTNQSGFLITQDSFPVTTSNPVNNVPSAHSLEVGIRYILDFQNPNSTIPSGDGTLRGAKNFPKVFNYFSVGSVISANQSIQYQGLPLDVIETDSYRTEGGDVISIDQLEVVFLPVRWFANSDCSSTITIENNLDKGWLHFCDRWGALKGLSSPFYVNSCQQHINFSRGNSNQAQCTLVDNIMYYPATTSNTCGSQWASGTSSINFTDTAVYATTSLGPCNDGICGWNSDSEIFQCYEFLDKTAETCGANCDGCDVSDCNDCGTARCESIIPTVTQCKSEPKCNSVMSCSNCKAKIFIPSWIWIVAIILFLAILVMFGILAVWSSKAKAEEEYSPSNRSKIDRSILDK